MSPWPGRAPPMFIRQRRRARPMLAFARCPGPSAPQPEAIGPQTSRAGPLTMTTGPSPCVVDCMLSMSKSGWLTARTAASTTGKCSGRQPAMTALIAIFSTVAWPGPIMPMITSGSVSTPASRASTRSSVGITTGRPSVHSRRWKTSSAVASSGAWWRVACRVTGGVPRAGR